MRKNNRPASPTRWLLKRNIALGIAVLLIMFLVYSFAGIRTARDVHQEVLSAEKYGTPITDSDVYWYGERLNRGFIYNRFATQETLCVIFTAIGFGSAMVLFRHLFSRKQAMMTASLPVSRTQDLLQRTECFALLTLLPTLLCCLLYPVAAAVFGVAGYMDMGSWTVRCLTVLMMQIYGYMLGVFCASLCGTIWSTVLGGIILGGSCEVIVYGWTSIAYGYRNTMPGDMHDPLKRMSPVFTMYKGFGNPADFSWLPGVLAILVLAVLAYLAYRENRPENTGYTLNIRKAEIPVSIWIMLFGIGAILAVAAAFVMSELYIWQCVILGAVVVWILLRMLLDQNIRLSLKHWAIPVGCLAAALLVLLGLKTDVTGYNSYFPSEDELKAVEYRWMNDEPVRLEQEENRSAFLQVAGMLRDAAESERQLRCYTQYPNASVTVTYETAGGSVKRCYPYLTDPAEQEKALAQWKTIVESDEYRAAQTVPEDSAIDVNNCLPTFGFWGPDFEEVFGFDCTVTLNPKADTAPITDALRADLQARTLEDLQSPVLLSLYFYKNDGVTGKALTSRWYTVHSCDVNTLRAILGEDAEKWIRYANGSFLENEDIIAFCCNYGGEPIVMTDWEKISSPEEAIALYSQSSFCESALYHYSTDRSRQMHLYSRTQVQEYLDNGFTDLDTVDWERLPDYEYRLPFYPVEIMTARD